MKAVPPVANKFYIVLAPVVVLQCNDQQTRINYALKLGLERIHQVTNTIRIANTGWRIRICIREYSDSLYSLAHSTNRMRGRTYIIHNNTETPIII